MTWFPSYILKQNLARVANDTWIISLPVNQLYGLGDYIFRIASDKDEDTIFTAQGAFNETEFTVNFEIANNLTNIRQKAYLYEVRFIKNLDSINTETTTIYRGVLTVL
jgi:hypothetical protein